MELENTSKKTFHFSLFTYNLNNGTQLNFSYKTERTRYAS